MARMNLVKRYWDFFDEVCDLTRKYCRLLTRGNDEQLRLIRPIRKQRLALMRELIGLGDELGLGVLSEREATLFLNNVFDKQTRKLYRKQAKRHKRTPISMEDLGREVFAQKIMLSKEHRRKKSNLENTENAATTSPEL